ncbi:MAG: hypothetical protein HKN44_03040, partial [Ilumatobacter sp.]|nr:hypothetical protein [Ilumatobacter sp.]
MDIIVRTSHGAADVSVEVNDESARLSDLVELIIGRPAPAVVLLDGHPVAANRPVVALPAGSIIDVDVPFAPADSAAPARLLQLTGPGAG